MRLLVTVAAAMLAMAGSALPARAGAPLPDADLDRTTAAGRVDPEPASTSGSQAQEPPSAGPQDPRGRYADGRALPPQPIHVIPAQNLLPIGGKNLFDQVNLIQR